jgi:Fuc2NAc and GlcNAc transferase
MRIDLIVLVVASALASAWITSTARRAAEARGVLDVPNERSSHKAPTPRGGGIGIVVTTLIGWCVLAWLRAIPLDLFLALGGGGAAVALVGFLDDRYQLSARSRIGVHVVAAAWGMFWLGGLPDIAMGENLFSFGWVGYGLGVIGIVWVLNLFNFMDGIDGIAGSEAVFVAAAGGLLHTLAGGGGGMVSAMLVLAAASLGFLRWNWPPARIFMGDVGSGYIGYVIAILAIGAARENAVALPVWLILGGVFFADATVTVARRMAHGERVDEPHRSHAYQWLSRRWESHLRVTMATVLVNVCWLLPWALFATLVPACAGWSVVCSLVPVAVVALVAGAGRPESAAS